MYLPEERHEIRVQGYEGTWDRLEAWPTDPMAYVSRGDGRVEIAVRREWVTLDGRPFGLPLRGTSLAP